MKPVLKYPGAKWRIADWIIIHMPEHHTYLEPFFGSGAVLFSKPASRIEVVNDLDDDVVNLFRLIRDEPEKLAGLVEATPYSRAEYDFCFDNPDSPDPDERARRFLVKCWMGYGFRTNGRKVGWKNDVQGRKKAYALSNWVRLPDWLLAATARLKEIQIENRPAVEVIERFKHPNVLIYADPPYVLETRTSKQYKCEMTDEDHIRLLDALKSHPGPVIISGYQSQLYNDLLRGWGIESIANTAEQGQPRTETIWLNHAAQVSQIKMQEILG